MLRKLSAAIAALLLTGGLGLAAGAPASASVIPHHGHYQGKDYHGRVVTLQFNGTQASHIMVGTQSFGGAHVSNAAWHETCANGWCTKGMWVTDTQIEGHWRHGSSGHWTPFTVNVPTQDTRYQGNYLGRDISSNPVQFSYHNGVLRHFRVNGHAVFAEAHVATNGVIPETCLNTWCFKGHWQDDYNVAGYWRSGAAGHWHYWDARAISS